jgi:hypothetical protein
MTGLASSTLRVGALALALAGPGAAQPAVGAPYCATHRGAGPAPPGLQGDVAAAFGIPLEAARNAVVRCAGETLLACFVGANLNCGKADQRRALPGASAYCRANPHSDFIPMFATGHATIYEWRCAGGRAIAGNAVVAVDAKGYAAGNWKEIRPK